MNITSTFPSSLKPVSLLDPADQTILRVLEHDWRRMCGMDVAPTHAQFNPAELDHALPHAFVLHRVAPGVARIRVAGQKLHDVMRMDPRGMPFASFFSEDSRETAMALLEHAFETPSVLGFSLSASRGLGRKPVRGEALLLPMRDSGGALTRMMGAIVTSGPLPNRAVRFDIAKGQPLRSDALQPGLYERRANRGRSPETAPHMDHNAPVVGAAAPQQTTSRPRLRLVVDNTV